MSETTKAAGARSQTRDYVEEGEKAFMESWNRAVARRKAEQERQEAERRLKADQAPNPDRKEA